MRTVAQLSLSEGKKVKVKTYKPAQGLETKSFSGVLQSFDGETIVFSGDFGEVRLTPAEISTINYDDFDDCKNIIDLEE